MAEYIERETAMLLPELPKEYRHYQTDNLDDAYEQGWDDALCCLEHIPSADFVPVVHGRWIEQEKYTFGTMYDCSICGDRILDNGHSWNYCPNCGAKMDGSSNEE